MRGKLEAPMQNDKTCVFVCVYMCGNVSVIADLCVDRDVCVSTDLISMDYEWKMSAWLSLLSTVITVKDCQCADFGLIPSEELLCMYVCMHWL